MGEGVFDQDFFKDSLAFTLKASVLLGVIGLCTGAFTIPIRREILARASGYDEITGRKIGSNGECSHRIHNRNYLKYNDPCNGDYVGKEVHKLQHELAIDNSLPKEAHRWASKQIGERMSDEDWMEYQRLKEEYSDKQLKTMLDKRWK